MAGGFGANTPSGYKPSQTTEYTSYNDAAGHGGRYTLAIPALDRVVRWHEKPEAFARLSRRFKVRIPGSRPQNDEPTIIWGGAGSFSDENFHGGEIEKETELVRVTNAENPSQYVDILRVKAIAFRDDRNRLHSFNLSW